jgi:hypothetical protein
MATECPIIIIIIIIISITIIIAQYLGPKKLYFCNEYDFYVCYLYTMDFHLGCPDSRKIRTTPPPI